MVSRLVRVQEAVGSNPATPTKNPQIFVQEAQKSEDSSFVKPGNLCETPTPGNAEKFDHRTDYLAETLTRSKRRQDRQRGRRFAASGLLFSPLFAALTSASPRSASLCLCVAVIDRSSSIVCIEDSNQLKFSYFHIRSNFTSSRFAADIPNLFTRWRNNN